MDREFCIDYILVDDCLDCPEREKDGECQTKSHCFEVKQKIIADLRKLEQIEQIINDWNNDASHSFVDMCKINGILNPSE